MSPREPGRSKDDNSVAVTQGYFVVVFVLDHRKVACEGRAAGKELERQYLSTSWTPINGSFVEMIGSSLTLKGAKFWQELLKNLL